jgi:hypothetical protein
MLGPSLLRDMNDNLSQSISDELGLPRALALLGKDLNGDGIPELEIADNLDTLFEISEAEKNAVQTFFNTADSNVLEVAARGLLQNATTRFVYDFDSYQTSVNLVKPVASVNPRLTFFRNGYILVQHATLINLFSNF